MTTHDPAGGSRREFLEAVALALAASVLPHEEAAAQAQYQTGGLAPVSGTEHWTAKRVGTDSVKLFLWRKRLQDPAAASGPMRSGTILFVHGSSVSATPVFDLQIPGRPQASTMDTFARLGY